ncbi:hypothetical protein SS50377_26912 [Spironucleus salmonicida]|uniref:Uncharacterized protein n=1 Tax=Spironucleus salmonicida TaxID=348837 RepID=V6LT39_9EUKA|nr:hypothetical protein SS50377_26912 [Spironucleus salmonicida]|eukprot:EST47423.1 Hypothetical protein SS50377_12408 [Spironucleus salmonicida]
MQDIELDPNDLLIETTKDLNLESFTNTQKDKYEDTTNDFSDTYGTPQVIQMENLPQSAFYNPIQSPTTNLVINTQPQSSSDNEDNDVNLSSSKFIASPSALELNSPINGLLTAINQTQLKTLEYDQSSEPLAEQTFEAQVNKPHIDGVINGSTTSLPEQIHESDQVQQICSQKLQQKDKQQSFQSITSAELDTMLDDMECRISEAQQDIQEVNTLTDQFNHSNQLQDSVFPNLQSLTDKQFDMTTDLDLQSKKLEIDLENFKQTHELENDYAMQNDDFAEFVGLKITQPIVNNNVTDFDNFSDDEQINEDFIQQSMLLQSQLDDELNYHIKTQASVSEIPQINCQGKENNFDAWDEASTSFVTNTVQHVQKNNQINEQDFLQKYICSPEKEAVEPLISSQNKLKLKFKWPANIPFSKKLSLEIKLK